MQQKTMVFITGLVTGILLSFLVIFLTVPKMLFTESESNYNFTETIERIEQSVQENNWSIPHQYNLQATLSKHGFEVKPVRVFSICKPDLAARLLTGDADRQLSAMMPCRIAIFEKSDGKTYITRINAGLLSKLLGAHAKAVMGEAGEGSEEILAPLID
ncbi:DUF302 domain-containing protein [uncultured Sunxiuqinia sp.]|uniref:DUF302 domain-containing protein n=1 Tax=uncultured Sunxiuqinia sp. TaxID=1573825 RepID=UPI00262FDFCA|nr:DUF302 domain-containing protein [uncultured Sunxiuqinia sp.]